MRKLLIAMLAATCAACAPVQSVQVEAIEVPLVTPEDHKDFVQMLQGFAAEEGLHVDARGWGTLPDIKVAIPTSDYRTMTGSMGVYRGNQDQDMELSILDLSVNRPWITFLDGDREDVPVVSRQRLLAKIKARWPGAKKVPVMPTGALPLNQDVVAVGDEYKVLRSAAERYQLPPDSPMIAPDQ